MALNKNSLLAGLSDEASRKSRTDLCEIIDFVLENIDPINIIGKAVELRTSKLFIKNDLVCDISDFKNIFVLGAGKAAYKMALAMENLLGYKVSKGYVNVPDLPEKNALRKIQINRASHPIPDQGGLNGSQEIMKLAKEAGADDLIICLISGGGSSLLPLPVVPLEEFIELNSLLLKSPATINEINAVRKHLSQISGGNLAVAAYPARLLSLIISDVVNDPLDVIASGPTVPDLSRFQEAIEVLKKYNLWTKVSENIRKYLDDGLNGINPETPKSDHPVFKGNRVNNYILANHRTVLDLAADKAEELGYRVEKLGSAVQGLARKVAQDLIDKAKISSGEKTIYLATGETTVDVKGTGQGGRNQELVLSGLNKLENNMTLVSFATDGVDGFCPEAVAGAMADKETLDKARELNLNPEIFLANNDSYNFFKNTGGQLISGPSGTNLGDLIMLVLN